MVVNYGPLPASHWDGIMPVVLIILFFSVVAVVALGTTEAYEDHPIFFFSLLGTAVLAGIAMIVGSSIPVSQERIAAEQSIITQAGYADAVRNGGRWYAYRDGEAIRVYLDETDQAGQYVVLEVDRD